MNKYIQYCAIFIIILVSVAGFNFQGNVLGAIEVLNDDNFTTKTRNGKAVVDFYADWCVPCQEMMPIYEEVSKEMGDVQFFKVNIEMAPVTIRDLNIESVPTVVLLQDGKEVKRQANTFENAESLKKFISN